MKKMNNFKMSLMFIFNLALVFSLELQFKEKFVTELAIYDPVPPPGEEAIPARSEALTDTEAPSANEVPSANRIASPNDADTIGLEPMFSGTDSTVEGKPDGSSLAKPAPKRQIPLGVYLATDRCFGTHTIYKISPMSMLSVMNLRVGDRITKVNNLSVDYWSHTCLVEFIRSLALNCVAKKTEGTRGRTVAATVVYDTKFSLTVRRASKMARTAEAVAAEDTVDATLRSDARTGTRVERVHEGEDRAYYASTVSYNVKLAEEDHVIRMDTSTAPGRVELGYLRSGDLAACLKFHTYNFPPRSPWTAGGQPVIIESASSTGTFMTPAAADDSSSIGIMESSTSPSLVTSVDSRFFRLVSTEGTRQHIVHMQTKMFLQPQGRSLRLVLNPTAEERASGSLEYELFPC